jgi:hypothetical protein
MLELIIATSMMAVLALTLYTSLRVAYRARDTANAAVGPARSAELAVGLVRRDLENALPPKGILAGPFIGQVGLNAAKASEVQFYSVTQPRRDVLTGTAGSSSSVSGRSGQSGGNSRMSGRMGGSSRAGGGGGTSGLGIGGTVDDPTAYGGVQRVSLLILPAEDGLGSAGESVLVRRVQRNLLATTEPPPEDEVLCRNVAAFTIRYFDGYQWVEDWDSTQLNDALPMAVEVSLAVNPPADSPAGRAAQAAAASGATPAAYRASRMFFLACRDDAALTQGATQ